MLLKFKESLKRLIGLDFELIPSAHAPTILIAVSGGIDSICMGNLFIESGYPNLVAATVNFSLRGTESDGDEAFVKEWSHSHGIKCHSTKFDTTTYAAQKGLSIQMAARQLRYGWFEQLSKENGYSYIALAHNLNDSVETFFINLLRGSGIKGMRGIPQKNGAIVRPLLIFSREEIERYVERQKLFYREDRSNLENYYSRNRLRNIIFPQFKSINPNFLQNIEESIERVGEANQVLDDLFNERERLFYDKSRSKISIQEILNSGNSRFWLYKILEPFGFKGTIISQIERSLEGESGRFFHSPTHTILKDREWLIIKPIEEENQSGPPQQKIELLSIAGEGMQILFYHRYYHLSIISKENSPASLDSFKEEAKRSPAPFATLYLDFEKVRVAAKEYSTVTTIRSWSAGDKFHPLGMKGKKRVSDLFIDLKLDNITKERVPIMAIGNKVVAILGYRIDASFKIDRGSQTILKIECVEE
ncbi:MAG: tRNA lysidine(34) synthetase TilS [Bacteroidales bacterium]